MKGIRMPRNNDRTEVHDLEARLAEAREQQAATSEILRVISQSPDDVQPVFDTIVAAAMKLCHAVSANFFTFDGRMVHLAALVNATPEAVEEIRRLWPRPLGRDMAASRAIMTCRPVAIPDVLTDPEFKPGASAAAANFRSIIAVPLVRDNRPIGAIAVGRPESGPFPGEQLTLLETFAAQAVIAIENVRLFNETKEALERQTSTSEILRVISGSPTDVQPVFQSIARAALELCRAGSGNVFTFDGKLVHLVAAVNRNTASCRTHWSGSASRPPMPGHRVHPRDPDAERRRNPGRPRGRRLRSGARLRHRRLSQHPGRSADAGRTTRSAQFAVGPRRTRPISRPANPAPANFRRPGRDRDRERAPVQRDERGAGATDRDERDPARDQPVADGRSAGIRCDRRRRDEALPLPVGKCLSPTTASSIHLKALVNVNPDYPPRYGRSSASARTRNRRRPRRPDRNVVIIPDVLEDREYGIGDSDADGRLSAASSVCRSARPEAIGASSSAAATG
jgi:hypothetical protein